MNFLDGVHVAYSSGFLCFVCLCSTPCAQWYPCLYALRPMVPMSPDKSILHYPFSFL